MPLQVECRVKSPLVHKSHPYVYLVLRAVFPTNISKMITENVILVQEAKFLGGWGLRPRTPVGLRRMGLRSQTPIVIHRTKKLYVNH